MRQLSSCDFCDTGDGLGVYEVGPDDAGADSRRLVLCPDCRERLDWVLEPFYDASAEESTTGSPHEDVTLLGVSDSRSRGASGEAGMSDPALGSDDADDTDTDTDTDTTDATAENILDGTPAGAVPSDEASDEGASDDSPTARPAGTSTAERAADDTPPKYRQVMRFLGNRDLPIDRMEAETLASGAYDLETGEAADIIDTAVERGLLIEEDGQLRPA